MQAQQSPITWDMFLEAFRKQYVPLTARKKMQSEFWASEQGDSTVDQYEAQFTALSRYDPESVQDETHKTQRFMIGLRPAIRDSLLLFKITSFNETFDRAQVVERGLEVS